jgi:2-phosphosulfolactate phosphatase
VAWQTSFVSIEACAQIAGIAVVVDVLRAFTTAAWAFHLGVERIVMTDKLDEALRLKALLPNSLALKDGEPAPGFDLVNSPVMLQERMDLRGRTIVSRTTHGTLGAVAARHASRLYCASFVCAAATAKAIRLQGACDVCFVVTGEEGAAEEDRACAEYIGRLLDDSSVDPELFLWRADRSKAAARLRGLAAGGSPGVHPDDVESCLEVDRFDFAMQASDEDGLLTLRPVRP